MSLDLNINWVKFYGAFIFNFTQGNYLQILANPKDKVIQNKKRRRKNNNNNNNKTKQKNKAKTKNKKIKTKTLQKCKIVIVKSNER